MKWTIANGDLSQCRRLARSPAAIVMTALAILLQGCANQSPDRVTHRSESSKIHTAAEFEERVAALKGNMTPAEVTWLLGKPDEISEQMFYPNGDKPWPGVVWLYLWPPRHLKINFHTNTQPAGVNDWDWVVSPSAN